MVLLERRWRRRCVLKTTDRLRFEVPLYTVAEATRIVDVPPTTLATWAKGDVRRPKGRGEVTGAPVVTYIVPGREGEPCIPFVGLAETLVLAAVRRSGEPMQRIRPALAELERELGVDHGRQLHRHSGHVLPLGPRQQRR
jgi:hypothetical protein